ncbi:MAG: DUF4863 family protein [Rhodobacteraceae bacterium]|nr:DUF4863 family protein [Paracoccaceae bacterium]
MPDQSLLKFTAIVEPVTTMISNGEIDAGLESRLNAAFPPSGETFRNIEKACHQAIAEGWMCSQGSEGRRFGRVLEPSPKTDNLSVDVVDLTSIVGPHHRHPTGEICMIMPVTETAQFDGHDAGWCVNPPGSAHHPTVTDGRALVLYLLPEGKIEFT